MEFSVNASFRELFTVVFLSLKFAFYSQKQHEDLEGREEATMALIAKGEDLMNRCEPEDCVQIAEKLKKLRDKWSDTKDRAKKRQVGPTSI